MIGLIKTLFIDFDVNAISTFNLLELTKKYTSKARFILCLQIKYMVTIPINLIFLKKKSFEIQKNHKFYKGFNESMSVESLYT